VVHRGEALDREQFRHRHAARTAAAAEIVAQQVDDHHVLGAILAARRQFVDRRCVGGRVGVARPRALDRPCLDPTLAHLKKALRRYRKHLAERQVQEGAARTGRALAQASEQRERIAPVARAESLRKVHLVDIALANVARHAIETLTIVGFGQIRLDTFDTNRVLPGQRAADRVLREQRAQPVDRIGAEHLRIGDSEHAAPCRVVGECSPAVDAYRKFRPVPVVFRDGGQSLDPAREVVAEVTQCSAGERQVGAGRCGTGAGTTDFPPQQRERIALREVKCGRTGRISMPFDLGDTAPGDHRGHGIGDHDVEARQRMRTVGMAVEEHRPGLPGHRQV